MISTHNKRYEFWQKVGERERVWERTWSLLIARTLSIKTGPSLSPVITNLEAPIMGALNYPQVPSILTQRRGRGGEQSSFIFKSVSERERDRKRGSNAVR